MGLVFCLLLTNIFQESIDSHSKDENHNLSSSATAVRLKYDTCSHLKITFNQIITMLTCKFYTIQVQLIKVACTFNANNTVKYAQRRHNCQESGRQIWMPKKENTAMIQKRKDRQLKKNP